MVSESRRRALQRMRRVSRAHLAWACLLSVGAIACGETEPSLPSVTIEVVSGSGQDGAVRVRLPEPFVVRVAVAGVPVEGALVEWLITQGAGSFDFSGPTRTTTDVLGLTQVTLTPGIEGPWTVTVTIVSVPTPIVTSAPLGSASFSGTAGPLVDVDVGLTFAVPQNFGLHDMYIRDGIAFLAAWNTGVIILDVGNGVRGGTPLAPVEISTAMTNAAPLQTPAAHNVWWFHNPVASEQRYLFVGQEGPGIVGAASSGDIHVVDISDMANPVEVAFFHMAGAGTHNFWMDEQAQVLYAAYYNGGVVALDVSGTLAGDLANRLITTNSPGGASGTYVWGVQFAGGNLYASDMLTGLWQLNPTTLAPVGGGNNVPERFGSDLWIHGSFAYTATWGSAARNGNRGDLIKVWSLSSTGAPVLVDSVKIGGVQTIGDIEVSPDGKLLMVPTERGFNTTGLYFYALTNPAKPRLVGRSLVGQGVHTATFSVIGDRLYAFAARDPPGSALLVLDVTALVP